MNLILNTVIVIDGETLGSDDPASVPRNVLHSLSKALDPAANHDKDDENFVFKAVRGEEAVNEYGATAENFYQAFPCEFPLAKGLTEGISGLPLGLARYLYLQHSCKAAHDSRIYSYAFNMLQRHTAATNAGVRLRNTTDCVKRYMSIVNAPGLLHCLRLAKLDPESEDAQGLVMLISPLLASAGRGIPYSLQARKSSFADFIASFYRFGCNFIFLTMALDDKSHVLCIRASHVSKRNAGFPFRDEGLRQAMQNRDGKFKFRSIETIRRELQRLTAKARRFFFGPSTSQTLRSFAWWRTTRSVPHSSLRRCIGILKLQKKKDNPFCSYSAEIIVADYI
jgi:hypothetical protein